MTWRVTTGFCAKSVGGVWSLVGELEIKNSESNEVANKDTAIFNRRLNGGNLTCDNLGFYILETHRYQFFYPQSYGTSGAKVRVRVEATPYSAQYYLFDLEIDSATWDLLPRFNFEGIWYKILHSWAVPAFVISPVPDQAINFQSDGFIGEDCLELRQYTSECRLTIDGYDKIGNQVIKSIDFDLALQNTTFTLDYTSFNLASITRAALRPLGVNKTLIPVVLDLKCHVYQLPTDVNGLVTGLGQLFNTDATAFRLSSEDCKLFAHVSGTGYAVSNKFLNYVGYVFVEIVNIDLSKVGDTVCCDNQLDETEPQPVEYEPDDDCDCDELRVNINNLSIRIQTLELQMLEIKSGLDCICQAIQNLVLSPQITVEPCEPVIQVQPSEVSVQVAAPSVQVAAPSVTVQPQITVEPCEPVIQVQPSEVAVQVAAPNVNMNVQPQEINISPCEPVINVLPSEVAVQVAAPVVNVNPNITVEPCTPTITLGADQVTLEVDLQPVVDAIEGLSDRFKTSEDQQEKNITEILEDGINGLQESIDGIEGVIIENEYRVSSNRVIDALDDVSVDKI